MNEGQFFQELTQCDEIRAAAKHLLQAHTAASVEKIDLWSFAIEIESLLSIGCTQTELRALVGAGLLHHAEEITGTDDANRVFHREPYLKFGPRSCFVLTSAGTTFFQRIYSSKENGTARHSTSGNRASKPNCHKARPRWNPEARELYAGPQLLKRFQRPAPTLQLVLSAFQEMRWPSHMDDPLPPQPGIVSAERLRDVIRRLNRCQRPQELLFASNGLGQGICWRWLGHQTAM